MRSSDALETAAQRRKTADRIIERLALARRWGRFGRPVVVGAYAYDLMIAPDIDMEVYCPRLAIEDGFMVLGECAPLSGVTGCSFANRLATPDKALYWRIDYLDDEGVEWKIDMWSAPEDYDLPRAEYLVSPLREALTPETRAAILDLKMFLRETADLSCLSIDLYRAVIDDNVRTGDELRAWLASHETGFLTPWRPGVSGA